MILSGTNLDIYNASGSLLFTRTMGFRMYQIKLLPDNRTVACGATNGSVLLFNLMNYTFGASYIAHNKTVMMLSLTPDLVYLISGANDSTLIMWTWSTMGLTQVNVFSVAGQVNSGAVLQPIYTGQLIFIFKSLKNYCTV
jgi:WD40 repeat protein